VKGTPCVLYAAKSTQDKHLSIPTQLKNGREKADEEDAWFVVGGKGVGEFWDEGFSAYSGNRGPDLVRAEEAAERAAKEHGTTAMLIVQHSDRLARGAGDSPGASDSLVEIWHRLRRKSVHVRSFQNDPMMGDPILVAVAAKQAYEESERKSKAVKDGNRRRAERGLPLGRGCLGLRPVKDGYEYIRAEIPVVERIFDEFDEGVSQRRSAANLEADGLPTVFGGKWSQSTIRQVLRNPVYKGVILYKGELLPGRHKPIIDPDRFDRVQRDLDAKAKSKGKGRGRPSKGLHIFEKGMLRAQCGEALVPRTTTNKTTEDYEVYLCHGRVRDVRNCDEGPYRRAAIDTAVYRYFEQVALDVEGTRDQLAAAHRAKSAEIAAYLERAITDQREAEERLARVRRDYTEGHIVAADWAGFRDELTPEVDAARSKTERLSAQLAEVEAQGEFADLEVEALEHLADLRRAVAGEIHDRAAVAKVRAALSRTFEGFQLKRIEPGMRVHAELAWQGDHIIEPIIREDAIRRDSSAPPLHPRIRREPVYIGGETINASASRSRMTSCGRASRRSCVAATAAETARSGSASC
jgi:site-specific DNA recombinase